MNQLKAKSLLEILLSKILIHLKDGSFNIFSSFTMCQAWESNIYILSWGQLLERGYDILMDSSLSIRDQTESIKGMRIYSIIV